MCHCHLIVDLIIFSELPRLHGEDGRYIGSRYMGTRNVNGFTSATVGHIKRAYQTNTAPNIGCE